MALMRRLAAFLLLFSGWTWAQSCAAGNTCQYGKWCQVFPANGVTDGVPSYHQNGWNTALYDELTGFIYQQGQAFQLADGTHDNPANPTCTTAACNPDNTGGAEAGPFSSDQFYTTVSVDANGCPLPYTVAPYTEFYSSGESGTPAASGVYMEAQAEARLWLAATPNPSSTESRPLSASDTTITFCQKQADCNAPTTSGFLSGIHDTGTIFLDDEVIDYSACVAYDKAANSSNFTVPMAPVTKSGITENCNQTAWQYVLTVATNCPKPSGTGRCRGQRTGAGWQSGGSDGGGQLGVAHNVNDATLRPSEGWAWLSTPKRYNANGTVEYGARINRNGRIGVCSNAPSTTCKVNADCSGGGTCQGHTTGAPFNFQYGDNTAANGFDGPTSRHQRFTTMSDKKRGKLWYTWGFQENIANLRDLWYLCVAVPSVAVGTSGTGQGSCTTSDLTKSWQHVNLSTAGHPYPSAPSALPCLNSTISSCQQEGQEIYVADPFDMLFLIGGVSSDDYFVVCLSPTSVQVKDCHTDGDINNAASYVSLQAMPGCNTTACRGALGSNVNGIATCNTGTNPNCHGYVGVRDGTIPVYDPDDFKVLLIGGRTSTTFNCTPGSTNGVCFTSVAQWNPMTDDWCFSDTSQNGRLTIGTVFNGSGCNTTNATLHQAPLPNHGASPYTESISMVYPAATWDPTIGQLVFFKADESSTKVWLYKPSTDAWTATAVTGGAAAPTAGNAIYNVNQTLVYVPTSDMFWYVDGNTGANLEMWELQGSALQATVPNPSVAPARSIMAKALARRPVRGHVEREAHAPVAVRRAAVRGSVVRPGWLDLDDNPYVPAQDAAVIDRKRLHF